ncbi:MAG: hypothetical protein Q4F07_07145 [Bacteroidales bacterium]|nr:hypothetical protein [Bacteroidales bacterium]
MSRILFLLLFAALSLPWLEARSNDAVPENTYAVTVKMHDGGTFTVAVGSEPVKIKIAGAGSKTIGAVMLGDTEITALLDSDGCITLNDADNPGTAITADTTITITFTETPQE